MHHEIGTFFVTLEYRFIYLLSPVPNPIQLQYPNFLKYLRADNACYCYGLFQSFFQFDIGNNVKIFCGYFAKHVWNVLFGLREHNPNMEIHLLWFYFISCNSYYNLSDATKYNLKTKKIDRRKMKMQIGTREEILHFSV